MHSLVADVGLIFSGIVFPFVLAKEKHVDNNFHFGGGPDTDDETNGKEHVCPDDPLNVSSRILLLPSNQNFNNDAVKAAVYFFLLVYFFLGISIAAHIFMLTIESILSVTKKKIVTRNQDGIEIREEKEIRVWNDTIANLTLIALGTSAPKILLSMIETFGNNFCGGSLAPGLIVGSASYNLLVITAVCIVSLPGESKKRIKEYKVFVVTSGFAVAAYVWLVVITQVVSRNVVEIWEGVVTVVFFPVLVGVAYWATLGFCIKGKRPPLKAPTKDRDPTGTLYAAEGAQRIFHYYDEWDDLIHPDGTLNLEAVRRLHKDINAIAVLTDEEIATIIATKLIQLRGRSLLWYKLRAIQSFTVGSRAFPSLNAKLKEVADVLDGLNPGMGRNLRSPATTKDTRANKAVIEFNATSMAIPIFVGSVPVTVRRTGKEDIGVHCRIDTLDGSAKRNIGYLPISTEVFFEPYVVEHTVLVNVIGDSSITTDTNFYMVARLADSTDRSQVALGPMCVMEVSIQEIKDAGEVTFTKNGQVVKDTKPFVDLEVDRENGSEGTVTVRWRANPGPKCTRLPGPIEGILQFEDGELKKILEIPIPPKLDISQCPDKAGSTKGTKDAASPEEEKETGDRDGDAKPAAAPKEPRTQQDEQFDVEFYEIQGTHGKIGRIAKCTVGLATDDQFVLQITRICEMAEEKSTLQSTFVKQTYVEQIKSAFIVNGTVEEAKRATKMDKILHWISLPWKMLFCILPPPHKFGGYPCCALSLCWIAVLTALIGDMATIFGHCLNMDPITTGFTILAIGTSLPDTFASRIAAIKATTADAAIGNITGTNCVNIFIGLGLPWTIASIVTTVKYGQGLPVKADTLSSIVAIYVVVAILAQIILWLRRHSVSFGFAELGGPTGTKWLTSATLAVGWLVYATLAILISQRFGGFHKFAVRFGKVIELA